MHAHQPRATLQTIGCRLNQAETASLAARLRLDGYQLVEVGQPTDLLLLNTCSVTENAEKDCRYLVRRTLRHSPAAFVAVTGCYAQTGAGALSRVDGIDLIVGTQFKTDLPDLLPPPGSLSKQPSPQVLHTRTIDRDDFTLPGVPLYNSSRANLKVQDGCNFMCSFCIIPFARGRERSRRFDDVCREAESLTEKGHRELVLTGVNIGQYNHQGRTLLDLIRNLENLPSLDRLRISSIEPTTISEELLDYMSTSSKLCPYLHLPLQSGDDGILMSMNRRYTVKMYCSFAEKAIQRVRDLGLGTDIMVGFPREGEREFGNTLAVANDLPFSYFHVFSYSKRPGTPAVRMPSPVASTTVSRRSRILSELSRTKRIAFYQCHMGRTMKVLFETTDQDGLSTGLTANYIRTQVRDERDLTNCMTETLITGVMDGLALGQLAQDRASAFPMVSL